MSRNLLRILLLGIAGTSLGLVAEAAAFEWNDLSRWVPDLIVGWALIGCGLVGWLRRSQSRVGPLLAASGVAWFLANFSTPALYLHRGPLIHAVLSFPRGRLSSKLDRATAVAGYVTGLVAPLGRNEVVVMAVGLLLIAAAVRSVLAATGLDRRARGSLNNQAPTRKPQSSLHRCRKCPAGGTRRIRGVLPVSPRCMGLACRTWAQTPR